jgi:hypothetical protein
MENLKYGPYSSSRLDVGVCPYRFHREYVDRQNKVKHPETLPQARGSAMHEVFEKITARMAAVIGAEREGQSTEPFLVRKEEIRAWVVEATKRHPAAYAEVDRLTHMADLYIKRPPAIMTDDALVEEMLAVRLENGRFVPCEFEDPRAAVRGKADILIIADDISTALICDHKTSPAANQTADTLQMGIYAWLVSKIHPGLPEVKTSIHMSAYGHYSPEVVWSLEDLARVEDELRTRISYIESIDDWSVAVPNDKCGFCPFLDNCPSMSQFVDKNPDGSITAKLNSVKILGDSRKAQAVAGFLAVYDVLYKQATDELKNYVKDAGTTKVATTMGEIETPAGAVAIPGYVYEYRVSEKRDYDKINKSQDEKERIMEIFRRVGWDPARFMGFSESFSKGVWMTENEQLLKELHEAIPLKVTTTFSGYKVN